MGKNGDPQTGWMKEEVLEQTGYHFKVDNCPQFRGCVGCGCA